MNVCLRCDWTGEGGPSCPRCGVRVFRETPVRRRPPAVAAPTPASPTPPAAGTPAGRRPGPAGAALGLALMLVASVLASVLVTRASPRGEPAPRAVAPIPRLSGTLVYARLGSSDRVQLWGWDLQTGRVRPGPIVPRPVELVAAARVAPDAIALTWREGDGLRAGLLRSLDPAATPEPLLRGDLVGWGDGGAGLSVVRIEPTSGCRRRVVVRGLRLAPRLLERPFRARICGGVEAIGRAGAVTYLTVREPDRVRVVYAAEHELRTVLDGYALASVSWASDLLVRPVGAAPPVAPAGRDPSPPPDPSLVPQASVAYHASSVADREAEPLPYGEPFALERVLAWSPDAFRALVLGRIGGERGLVALDTAPGDGLRPPVMLAAVRSPASEVWGTFAADGTAIVVGDGRVLLVSGRRVLSLPPPAGAPLPDGPIAWIG